MSQIKNETSPINIFWFRRDLRLTDNHGLYRALRSDLPVLPLFIFDRNILDQLHDRQDRRVDFIHQILSEIHTRLARHNSSLLVLYGEPLQVWQQLLNQFKIHTVFINHDYEPYAIKRDEKIKHLLSARGINFASYKDQVIFEKNEIMKQDQKPYSIYTPYRLAWQKLLRAENVQPYPSERFLNKLFKNNPAIFPDLAAIGFASSGFNFPSRQIQKSIIINYTRMKDFPSRNGTTRLGVHLRFGTVSIRKLIRLALELNETWLSELIWREFFMMILYHFPQVVQQPFKNKFNMIPWRNNQEEFERWCTGQTGYPLVDAGMRELNQTGFMHNRVRMVTASFLTKHLLIDWRRGEHYFAVKLLDYDLASNNGNWQWVAGCGCDAVPYFRIFNPVTQQKKFDSDETYIKKWIAELDSASYPKPIVDHTFAYQRAQSALSQSQF